MNDNESSWATNNIPVTRWKLQSVFARVTFVSTLSIKLKSVPDKCAFETQMHSNKEILRKIGKWLFDVKNQYKAYDNHDSDNNGCYDNKVANYKCG